MMMMIIRKIFIGANYLQGSPISSLNITQNFPISNASDLTEDQANWLQHWTTILAQFTATVPLPPTKVWVSTLNIVSSTQT